MTTAILRPSPETDGLWVVQPVTAHGEPDGPWGSGSTLAAAFADLAAIRTILRHLDAQQYSPHVVLACAGYSDEHWQVYARRDDEYPTFVVHPDGTIDDHPDAPVAISLP